MIGAEQASTTERHGDSRLHEDVSLRCEVQARRRRRRPRSPCLRRPPSPCYVLTLASSTSPASRNTMFGSQAATRRIDHAAGAHRLHDLGDEQEDDGRAEADRDAHRGAGARGLVTASGAPNRAMIRQVAGSASLSACSTISLLASLPERLSASM